MKNQYFGDTRDLFKYDLIEHLMGHLHPRRFAFIAMLTEDDDTDHGKKRNYSTARAGSANEDLIEFLGKSSSTRTKDFTRIQRYYERKNIHALTYDRLFTHANRIAYFSKIPSNFLQAPLVFFDPDIGFNPKSSFDERHLALIEFVNIANRASENSVIMTIQFYPRMKRDQFIKDKLRDLKAATGFNFLFIGTTEVLFLLMSKSQHSLKKLTAALESYKAKYPAAYTNVSEFYSNKR